MKVITIKNDKLAINPRDILFFSKDEILEEGYNESKKLSLTIANLERMIELKFAKSYSESSEPEIEVEEVDTETTETDNDDIIESFDDKDDLEEYAKEIYGIELDKRKSLDNMKVQLKEELQKEDNE